MSKRENEVETLLKKLEHFRVHLVVCECVSGVAYFAVIDFFSLSFLLVLSLRDDRAPLIFSCNLKTSSFIDKVSKSKNESKTFSWLNYLRFKQV